jgi:TonB family protein
MISVLSSAQAIAQRVDQNRETAQSVYIVAEAVSDASPFWFKYVIDLNPAADVLQPRWIRIAPFGNGCPGVTVKAMTGVIKGPISRIVEPNLCSVSPATVNRALTRSKRLSSIWDTVGFGLVAQCGGSTREFHLPLADLVDMNRLKRESREAAALYDTYSGIVRSAFPNKSFYNISKEQDLELQEQGSRFIPELQSGKFDAGLSMGSFATILGEYRGIRADAQEVSTTVQVVTPNKETFVQYTEPIYPPLARQARIQGDVELDLELEDSGQVRNVLSVRGHPLLVNSAKQAAEKWRFLAAPQASPQLRVALKYMIGKCE